MLRLVMMHVQVFASIDVSRHADLYAEPYYRNCFIQPLSRTIDQATPAQMTSKLVFITHDEGKSLCS